MRGESSKNCSVMHSGTGRVIETVQGGHIQATSESFDVFLKSNWRGTEIPYINFQLLQVFNGILSMYTQTFHVHAWGKPVHGRKTKP